MAPDETRTDTGVTRSRMPAALSRIVSPLLDLLFPPLCHCCRAFIPEPGEVRLCPSCREGALPIEGPLCSCCGRPFATPGGMDHLTQALIGEIMLPAAKDKGWEGATQVLIEEVLDQPLVLAELRDDDVGAGEGLFHVIDDLELGAGRLGILPGLLDDLRLPVQVGG